MENDPRVTIEEFAEDFYVNYDNISYLKQSEGDEILTGIYFNCDRIIYVEATVKEVLGILRKMNPERFKFESAPPEIKEVMHSFSKIRLPSNK